MSIQQLTWETTTTIPCQALNKCGKERDYCQSTLSIAPHKVIIRPRMFGDYSTPHVWWLFGPACLVIIRPRMFGDYSAPPVWWLFGPACLVIIRPRMWNFRHICVIVCEYSAYPPLTRCIFAQLAAYIVNLPLMFAKLPLIPPLVQGKFSPYPTPSRVTWYPPYSALLSWVFDLCRLYCKYAFLRFFFCPNRTMKWLIFAQFVPCGRRIFAPRPFRRRWSGRE